MDEQKLRDDALFDALNEGKKKKRRKRIRTTLIVIAVIAALLFIAVQYLQGRVRAAVAKTSEAVQTWTVSYGSVSTTVSGSGTIQDVDAEEISVPGGVEIKDVTVDPNTKLHKGDILATVDMTTVMSALADVQSQIEEKDKSLAEASADSVGTVVTAGVAGRVKRVYAQPGDDVAACMVEHGALALLSQDGYMALELDGASLNAGDAVTVVRADDSELEGKVERSSGGKTVILISDRGPALDEEVQVRGEDGTELGAGTLTIHNPIRVVGYTGKIASVQAREEQNVWAGSGLFRLTDTAASARSSAILKERQELEDTMMTLLTILRDGALCAPFDGTVLSVEYGKEEEQSSQSSTAEQVSAAYAQSASSAASSDGTETRVLTLARDEQMSVTIPVDEADILALELGQEATLTIESIGKDSYTGTVTEIDRTASSSGGVTAYSAKITFDKKPLMLGGMTADVAIRIDGTEHVLIVPTDAVNRTSVSAYVYTGYDAENGQFLAPVTVSLGISNKDYTEIREGLREGDVVYYFEKEEPFMFMMGGGMGPGTMGPGDMDRPEFGG